jgi:hypothetical protein
MRLRLPSRLLVVLAVVSGAGAVAGSIALWSALTGPAGGSGASASAGFGWFNAGPPPGNWLPRVLPGGGAILFYPPSLRPEKSDPGAISVSDATPAGTVRVYLNATPRQGEETTAGWAAFRVEHLADDAAAGAHLDAAAADLAFRGGRGSCVVDHYTTNVGAHQYREIACYVEGGHRSGVVIAAARLADWGKYAPVLERAINAFQLTSGVAG